MYKIKDINLFIQGAESIDKRRSDIKRVLNSLISILNKSMTTLIDTLIEEGAIPKKRRDGEILLQIPFDSFNLAVRSRKTFLFFEFSDKQDEYLGWPEHRGVPAQTVLMVYNCLPEMINKLIERFPGAGIQKHFDFFIAQATEEQ